MCHHAENKNIALLGVKTIRKVGGLEKNNTFTAVMKITAGFLKANKGVN